MKIFDRLPPMEHLRSEKMSFVQLIMPVESSHWAITYLGDLGLLQFKDMNEDKSPFQRTFINQYWAQQHLSFPIFFLTNVASSTVEYVKSFLEWMSDSIAKSFEHTRDNAFLLKASIQKSLGSSEKDPSPASGSLEKNRKKQGSNPSRLSSKEKVTKAPQYKIKVGAGEKKSACLPPKQSQASWKRASLDSKAMAAGGGGVQSKTASVNAPRMLPKPTLSRTLSKTAVPPVNIQKRSSIGVNLYTKS